MSQSQNQPVNEQAQELPARQFPAVREAIAAIKAQHRVSETSAYAMLIRAAVAA